MRRLTNLGLFLVIFLSLIAKDSGHILAAVDLIYFLATAEADNILLEWETAQEINNVGFFIQRRTDEDVIFKQIGDFIPSGDDPFTGNYYFYHDYSADPGVLYCYRLEILDASGYSEFSDPDCAIITQKTPTSTAALTTTSTPIPTSSSTPKKTRTITPTSTLTRSPTPRPSATKTPSPTPTGPTITASLTVTSTPTPTLTLSLSSLINQAFPLPTFTATALRVDAVEHIPNRPLDESSRTQLPQRMYLVSIIVMILWFLLACFLVFYLRRLKK